MEKCWLCETNRGSSKYNIRFDLHKIISQDNHYTFIPLSATSKIKYKTTYVTVPCCPSCAKEQRKSMWISGLFATPMTFIAAIGTGYILSEKFNVSDSWSIIWGVLSLILYGIVFIFISVLIWHGLIRVGIVSEGSTNMIPGRTVDEYPELVRLKKQGWKIGKKPQ